MLSIYECALIYIIIHGLLWNNSLNNYFQYSFLLQAQNNVTTIKSKPKGRAAIVNQPLTEFSLVLQSAVMNYAAIGFIAADDFNKSDSVHEAGYTIYCHDGELRRGGGKTKSGKYLSKVIKVGSVIRCVRNLNKKTITFHINDKDAGVAYSDVPEGPLHPFVEMTSDASVKITAWQL